MAEIYSSRATPVLKALVGAAFTRQEIRDWLTEGTQWATEYRGAASLHADQEKRRGKTNQAFYLNYWWGPKTLEGCQPEGSTACEVDAMLFLEAMSGRRLAVHIEHKAPGERFRYGQVEAYTLRAQRFTNPEICPRNLPPHDDGMTLLLGQGDGFDRVIGPQEFVERIGADHV